MVIKNKFVFFLFMILIIGCQNDGINNKEVKNTRSKDFQQLQIEVNDELTLYVLEKAERNNENTVDLLITQYQLNVQKNLSRSEKLLLKKVPLEKGIYPVDPSFIEGIEASYITRTENASPISSRNIGNHDQVEVKNYNSEKSELEISVKLKFEEGISLEEKEALNILANSLVIQI